MTDVHWLRPAGGRLAAVHDLPPGVPITTHAVSVTCETCRAAMPEPWPPFTWGEGCIPTPDQLREWLHRFAPGQDARPAADMILGMLEAERRAHASTRMQYDASQAALADVLTENRRNRLAWLSARRRARNAYADGYADGMIEA